MTGRASLTFGSGYGTESDVDRALAEGESLPGTGGFAGVIDDRFVRDVLGRVPLYVEASSLAHEPANGDGTAGDRIRRVDERDLADRLETPEPDRLPRAGPIDRDVWSHVPGDLREPVTVPAGAVGSTAGFERYWRLPAPEPDDDHEHVLERLDRAIRTATTVYADDPVAVAFSGGVDSALLAGLLETPLYVVGFPDSHDVDAARDAAEALGRSEDLHVRELTLDSVERAIPVVAREIGRTNAMDVAIATSLYLVAEAAAEDGIERLVLGQGADELFGGYEKVYRLDHRVEAETVRGAVREQIATIPTQLPRDVLAVGAGGVDPVMPYLHDDVIATALRLPTDLIGSGATRKRALRRVASDYLPESIATREKKAFQYGSLVSRELDRLARQAGYKRRMDDHVERYVESRLTGS